jgi:hypothetical protein
VAARRRFCSCRLGPLRKIDVVVDGRFHAAYNIHERDPTGAAMFCAPVTHDLVRVPVVVVQVVVVVDGGAER